MLENLESIVKPIISYKTHAGKNIFSSISDVFYRENYLSDILSYYLSFDLTKRKLFEWINASLKESELIFEDYRMGEILREDSRIDIVIYSYDREKAIIIENKSNNADDQDKQLPRYYNILVKKGVIVESIIYLNKNILKNPDTTGWTKEEEFAVKSKLISVQLVGANSFASNVIDKVLQQSNDIRLSGISHEIKCLIYNLIYGDMNMDDLAVFVNELKQGNNLENLKKAINAYNDLPKYWREYYKKILEQLKLNGQISASFRIGIHKDTCLYVDNIIIDKINYAFDVWFSHECVDYSFLTRNGHDSDIEILKNKMGSKWRFGNTIEAGRYRFYYNEPFNEDVITKNITDIINSFQGFI